MLLGSLAALAIMAAPALAKHASIQPTEEKPAPPACHTLQPGPDGVWVERPCQELGTPAPAPAKPARRAETAGH
jgi:hypothetical protein